jgi:acetyl esterase/lipase
VAVPSITSSKEAEMPETPKTIEELARLRIVHPLPAGPPARMLKDLPYGGDGSPELRMDVYLPAAPAAGALPVVLLVHGGPIPRMGAKRLGVFVSYGELLAASGLAAVAIDHRFLAPERLPDAAADVATALAYVRGQAGELGVDGERVALWAFSGGGPLLSVGLRDGGLRVRALVAFYAALDLRESSPGAAGGLGEAERRELSPLHHLNDGATVPPMLIARAGQDHPALNATIDRFVAAALARNVTFDLLNHASGRHGFDILDDDARSREIIARAVGFLQHHLGQERVRD